MSDRATSLRTLAGSTVLVTGATGFTGTNLVRKLVNAGVDVRAIARPSSRVADDLAGAVEWVRGDVYEAHTVSTAMDGAAYVFHLAACFRDPAAADEEYRKVHVQSTRMLAEAALRQPGFRRFIHVSTIGVHGHVEEPPADETAPYNPGDVYQRTKLEGERWIRAFASDRELPVVVVRPAAIMGPGDRRLLKLFKFAKYGVFPLLDGHDTRYHLIHVEDLTDCLIICANHVDAVDEVFICGNEAPTSVVEIVSEIGTMLGKHVRFVHLPSAPLFWLANLVEWASERAGVSPVLHRRRVAFFTKDRAFDTTKLREFLGFACRFDNVSGLRDTVRGYQRAGWL